MALLFKTDRRLGELPEKLQPLEKCGPALLCPPFLNINHSATIEPAPAASHPLLGDGSHSGMLGCPGMMRECIWNSCQPHYLYHHVMGVKHMDLAHICGRYCAWGFAYIKFLQQPCKELPSSKSWIQWGSQRWSYLCTCHSQWVDTGPSASKCMRSEDNNNNNNKN